MSVFLLIITFRNFVEVTGGAYNVFHYIYISSKQFIDLIIFDPQMLYIHIKAFYFERTKIFSPLILNLISNPYSFLNNLPQILKSFLTVLVSTVSSMSSATPLFYIKSFNLDLIYIILGPGLAVFGTEILVDWLKHAFITKFNLISPSVYSKFYDSLCRDLTCSGRIPSLSSTPRSVDPPTVAGDSGLLMSDKDEGNHSINDNQRKKVIYTLILFNMRFATLILYHNY